MTEADSHLDWALNAARLRFGPHVACRREGDHRCCIYLELPGAERKLLGMGADWPEAMVEAVKANPDIPQPPPTTPAPPPVGEEFIEEFCRAMRQRDLMTEFLVWYGEKGDKDPDGHPRALHRGEWLEQLGAFIAGLDE